MLFKKTFSYLAFVSFCLISAAAWGKAHFNFATGELSLPVVAVQNQEGRVIQHYSVLMQLAPDSQRFKLIKAIPTEPLPNPATTDAIFSLQPNASLSGGELQIPAIETVNSAGIVETYYQAQLIFDESSNSFSIVNLAETTNNSQPFQRFYLGTENQLPLKRGGNNQYLLPVEIGHQILNLLVDTGSNSLLVFEDALATPQTSAVRRSNQHIQLTGEQVSKGFVSTQRTGVVATAPVRIGAFYAPEMRIMLIREPTSDTDPSLSIKNADGIIGLRRLEGVTHKRGQLDVPLNSLQPAIHTYELNLPPDSLATLSLGHSPHFANIDAQYVFQAKTFLMSDGLNVEQTIHTDLQVPFNISTRVGGVQADELTDLDVLLDTGAVSKLVLDISIAERIGYDPETQRWTLPPDEEVDISLIGLHGNIQLQPALTIGDISVAAYTERGVSFEAVLGINHWQHYIVAYHHERDSDGVADGTLSLLHRSHIQQKIAANPSERLSPLEGLNSVADEQSPSASLDGKRIAFQSNRSSGVGGWDIYVWDDTQQSLLDLPNLNSDADDTAPCLSADGSLLVLQSLREGNADVLLYDLTQQQFLSTPNLNTLDDEQQPCLSPDGQNIIFNSERDTGQGGEDLYLYERGTQSLKGLPNLNENGDETHGHFSPEGDVISFNFAGNNYLYSLNSLSLIEFSDSSTLNDDNANEGAINLSHNKIALHSNRNNPQLGLYDRDILLFNALTQTPIPTPYLNSNANELDPVFADAGRTLLFSSNRASGLGGHDLYAYRLVNAPATALTPTAATTEETPLSTTANLRNVAEQGYTIPVTLAGQQLNLLVLTEFSGIALFTDKLTSDTLVDSQATFDWLGMLTGTVGMTSVTLHGRELKDILVLLTDSQTFTTQFTLLADLPVEQIDGIFGLRQQGFGDDYALLDAPIVKMVPAVKRYELNLQNDLAYLSLGKMPHLDVLNPNDLIHHYIADSDFVDIKFESLIFNDAGQVANATTLFSTLLKNDIFIAAEVANSLGYQAEQGSWGETQSLNIHLNGQNSGKLLSVVDALSVQHAQVQDLSAFDPYTLILGQAFWEDLVIGVDSDENGQLVSIGALSDKPTDTTPEQALSQFIPLPFNSEADEKAPDISADGNIIVFQSNAVGGAGGWDIYVYHRELGFLTLPELNSSADEQAPSINQDGSLIAFHSNRSGQDDVYVFHVPTRSFLDLSAVNTSEPETYADLSGDGQYLALQRDTTVQVAPTPSTAAYSYLDSNIVLYDLSNQVVIATEVINTKARDNHPHLNQDGGLLVFSARGRTEMQGVLGSAHLFDRAQGQVLDSQALFSTVVGETAQYTHISPAGNYISFSSDRKTVGLKQRGQDIYLYDKAAGEFLFLPGLNSNNEDSAPALSNQAEYIIFQSHRAGGQGGYDLYLYQRSLDVPQYSTVMAYNEYGTVLGAGDVPLAFTQINILDGNGNIINTVYSDAEGRFQATVPEGVATPVTFVSADGLAKIVTSEDEDARDTELPLFTPGNIKFTGIDTPTQAYAGMPITVEFELETEQIKYNTHIQIFAKNLAKTEATTAAQWEVTRTDFNQIEFDAQIASILIEQFGHRQDYTQPLVLNPQDGITTELTYQPGTDNRVVQVKHRFILPRSLVEGDYGLVFTINKDDLDSDDDHLQAEVFEDLDDNYRVSRQTLNIGLADKPNLHILSATTAGNNSFLLPVAPATADGINPYGDFGLNLEVEALAQDVIPAVDVIFELEVAGQRYPLAHAIPNHVGDPVMTFGHRFEQNCDSQGCIAFKTREKRGVTFGLSLTETVYEYLKAQTEDTFVQLVVTVDPNNQIEEFQDYKTDNVRKLPLLYIAPEPVNLRAGKGKSGGSSSNATNNSGGGNTQFSITNGMHVEVPDDYEKSLFPSLIDFNQKVGPDKANIAFVAEGPKITYRTDPIEFDDKTIDLPTAASFKLYSQVPVQLLDTNIDLFFMGGYANVDANDLPSSSTFAGLVLLGQQVFSLTEVIGNKLDKRGNGQPDSTQGAAGQNQEDARTQAAAKEKEAENKTKVAKEREDVAVNKDKTAKEKEDVAADKNKVAKEKEDTANKTQSEADLAKEKVKNATTDAEKAKAQEEADKAQAKADRAKAEFDQVETDRVKAQEEANKARVEAGNARIEADKAQEDASNAQKEQAETALNAYKTNLSDAQKNLSNATTDAERASAQAEIDKAQADINKAEKDIAKVNADKRVEEANKQVEDAKNKSQAEQDAAKTAQGEALKAQDDARQAQKLAEEAQTKATLDDYQTDLNNSQNNVKQAQAELDNATTDADRARAQAALNQAQAEAAEAQANLTKTQTDIDKAKADARVEEANKRVEEAKNKSQTEQDAAKSAQDDALKAQNDARQAQKLAEEAQTKATLDYYQTDLNNSQNNVKQAQAELDNATTDADRARAQAALDQAQAEAEQAQVEVTKIQADIDKAEADARIEEANKRVEEAKNKGQAEQQAAKNAQETAIQAQKLAEEKQTSATHHQIAASNADEAQAEADNAQENAKQAQAKADNAQENAKQAQTELDNATTDAQRAAAQAAVDKAQAAATEAQAAANQAQAAANRAQKVADQAQDAAVQAQVDSAEAQANATKFEKDIKKADADALVQQANKRLQEAKDPAEQAAAKTALAEAKKAQTDAIQAQKSAKEQQAAAKLNRIAVYNRNNNNPSAGKALMKESLLDLINGEEEEEDAGEDEVAEAELEKTDSLSAQLSADTLRAGTTGNNQNANTAGSGSGDDDAAAEEDEGEEGIVLLDSKDKAGNERWTKDWQYPDPEKGQRLEYRFMVGPVPMAIKAGIQGDVGVQGKVSIQPSNIFTVEVGPSANVSAFASAAVDGIIYSVGVEIDLIMLEVSLKPKGEIQLLPGYPLALFRIQAPLLIELLRGEFFGFVRVDTFLWKEEWKFTIVDWDAPVAWNVPIFPPQAWAVGAVERYKRMSDREMIPAILELQEQAPDLLTDEAAEAYEAGQLQKNNITIADIQNGEIEGVFVNNENEYEGYEDTWEGFYNLKAQDYTIKIFTDGAFCMGMDIDANGVIEDEETNFSLFTGPNNVLHEIKSFESSGSGIDGLEQEVPDGLSGQLVGEGCLDGDDDSWEAAKEEWSEEWQEKYSRVYTIKLRLGTKAARRIRIRYYSDHLDETPRFKVIWSQTNKFIATYSEAGIPKYIDLDTRINHNWTLGSPLKDVVSPDNFDAEWSGKFEFEADTYMFLVKANDSATLELDNVVLTTDIDGGWATMNRPMQNRQYEVKVNYHENKGNANVKVDWAPFKGKQVEYYKTPEREVVLDDVGGGILSALPIGETTKKQAYGRYRFVLKVEPPQAGLHDFYLNVGQLGTYTVSINGEVMAGLGNVSSQIAGSGRGVHVSRELSAGFYLISIDTFKASRHPELTIQPRVANHFDWTLYSNAKHLANNSNAVYVAPRPTVNADFTDIELNFQGNIRDAINPATPLYRPQNFAQYATAQRWEGDFEFENAVYAFYFSSTRADDIQVLIDGVPFVSSDHTIGRHESADGRITNTVFTIPMNAGKHRIQITYAGTGTRSESGALFFDWKKAEAGYYYRLLPGNTQALDATFIETQAPLPARNELDPTVRLYIEAPEATVAGQPLSGTWAGVFNFGRGIRFISVDYVNDDPNDQGECRLFVDGSSLFGKNNAGWVAGHELVAQIYDYDFPFSGQHSLTLECRHVTAPAEFIIGAPKTDAYPITNRVTRSDCVQKQHEGTASGNPAVSDACEKAKPEQKRWIYDPVTEVGGYLRDGGKYTMCLSLSEDGRLITTDCCIGGVQQHRGWIYDDDTGAIQHATQPAQCLTKADADPNGQLYLRPCQTPLSGAQTWKIPNTEVYKGLIPTPVRQCEGYLTLPTGGIPAPVSSTATQACAVTQQGNVRCWGEGLGHAPTGNVPDITDTVALASSKSLHCAVDRYGKVSCWDTQLASANGLIAGLANDTVLQLVAGDRHHCALLDNGRVKCWGDNSAEQLGHNSQTADYVLTENSTPQEGITAISAAGDETCAAMSFGRVGCWGEGSKQVKLILGLGRVQQLSIAQDYGCAILDDSALQCWGKNHQGRLGNGTDSQDNVVPEYVQGLRNGIVGLSVSTNHACAITHDGQLYCWGDNSHGQLGKAGLSHSAESVLVAGLESVRHVSTAAYHSCAMLAGDAGVYCWGDNANGQLGADTTDPLSFTPVAVGAQAEGTVELTVQAGSQHSCLLDTEGQVLCWGHNQYGQLGTGDIEDNPMPTQVDGLDNITTLISQGQHNCVLDIQGQAYCWGNNQNGQLGDGSDINRTRPVAVDLSELFAKATQQPYGLTTHITHLDSSHNHTCALLNSRQVACWGSNGRGELGRTAHNTDTDPRLPGLVQSLYDVHAIAVGDGFSCAALTGRSVWCWGATPVGNYSEPTRLSLQADQLRARGDVLCGLQQAANADRYTAACLGGNTANTSYGSLHDLSVSSHHQCALLETDAVNNVECHGENTYGQLGYLTAGNRGVVELADEAVQVATGDNHSCAVLQNGQIYCWGDNTYGQLGGGDVADAPSLPVLVLGSQDGTARSQPIAAGEQHSCMLDAQQQVYCWGDNSRGQLGNGSQDSLLQPVFPVVGLDTPILALSSGGHSSCAIDTEGAAFCWGANDMGQLGTGNTTDSLTAQTVLGLSNGVSHIAHAGAYACAIVDNGVRCWGSNFSRIVSPNDELSHSRPRKITGLQGGIADLAVNPLQACAVVSGFTTAGKVHCWGHNKTYPQAIADLDNIQALSAEAAGFCALNATGEVYCWRNNQRPEAVTLPSPASVISSGRAHSCALLDNDKVYCWGENSGDASSNNTTPVAVAGLPTDVTHLSSYYNHTCVYTATHKGYCWGENQNGQLGNASVESSAKATEVQMLSLVDTSDILTNATLAARQHSCAVNSPGILSCWGDNSHGQLGNGHTQHQYSPIIVSALTDAVQEVVTGEGFTCVRDDTGQVQCWGSNSHGQLGNASNTDSLQPVSVQGLDTQTVLKLSAGQHHACALTTDSENVTATGNTTQGNAVYCWGNRLTTATPVAGLPTNLLTLDSNGTYNCALSAIGQVNCWHQEAVINIEPIELETSLALSVGETQSCAINHQGAVACWDNANPQPRRIDTLHHSVVSVVSGLHHHCAVQKTSDGHQVLCWNHSDTAPIFGQLGDGSSQNSLKPVPVKLAYHTVTAISAGDNHTCVQLDNGLAQCWGQNYTGQLGDGTGIDRLEPVNASLYVDSAMQPLGHLTQVTLAANTACALNDAGRIKCWGALGEAVDYARDGSWHADFTTHNIKADFTAAQVVTGQQHACAITTPMTAEDATDDTPINQLYCWGNNDSGQLGDGSLLAGQQPQQVALQSSIFIEAVTVGREHTCALAQTGQVYCWGNNDQGQLGAGLSLEATSLQPLPVDTTAEHLFAHTDNQCALGDSLTCWGANDAAQLGNGNTQLQTTPALVQGINDPVIQLVGGTAHRCALTQTGEVYCWGDNLYSQLGSGADDTQMQASLVANLGVITQLSSGDDHTCAVSNDKAVYCWGKNRFGQLGNGDNQPQNRAVHLSSLTATQVVTGKQHSCALSTSGSVYCWGDNLHGQLGHAESDAQHYPFKVAELSDINAIYASGDYSCALNNSGQLYCWGDNRQGQLGDATRVSRHTPQLVRGPNDPVIAEGDRLDIMLETSDRMTNISLHASDADGDALSWAVTSEPTLGAVIPEETSSTMNLIYIADHTFTEGSDTLAVRVSDGNGGHDQITIHVHKGVDIVLIDQGASLDVDVMASTPVTPVDIELSATSTAEALQWQVSTAPRHGEVTLNAQATQLQLTYTPELDYVGEDSLTVTVENEHGIRASILLNINIYAVALVIDQGERLDIEASSSPPVEPMVLDLSATSASEALEWQVSTAPRYGEVTLNADAAQLQLTYIPEVDYVGEDSLTITVTNALGDTASIVIRINVSSTTPLNNAPAIVQGDNVSYTVDVSETLVPLALTAIDLDSQDSLNWQISAPATYGQASLSNSSGDSVMVHYIPVSNYLGQDSFTVEVSDQQGEVDSIVVMVEVTQSNSAVTVVSDGDILSFTLNEDQALSDTPLVTLRLLGHSPASITWTHQHPDITLQVDDATGNVAVYYPLPANYYGSEQVSINAANAQGQSSLITLEITVNPVNDPPYLEDASPAIAVKAVTVNQNTVSAPSSVAIPLIAVDLDGDDASGYQWIVSQPPGHGTVNITPSADKLSATVVYTPELNYNSNTNLADNGIDDVVQITVREASGASDTVKLELRVAPVNSAPIFEESTALTFELNEDNNDKPSIVTSAHAMSITVVDSGGANEALIWEISQAPLHGSAHFVDAQGQYINNDRFENTLLYTPNLDYNGTDQLVITVTDSQGFSITSTITLNINPVNDIPIIEEGSSVRVVMDEDGNPQPFELRLHAVDVDENDSLGWSTHTPPTHGAVTYRDNQGVLDVSYLPNPNYNGSDFFILEVQDTMGASAQIAVLVLIGVVTDAPVIQEGDSLSFIFDEDTIPNPVAILNVRDVDSDFVSWTFPVDPTTGTANVNVNNAYGKNVNIMYSTPANYNGTDNFVVQVTDERGMFDIMAIDVLINPINDPPYLEDTSSAQATKHATLAENTPRASSSIGIPLTAIDLDGIDANSYVWTIPMPPAHGTASISVNPDKLTATLTYVPTTYYNSDKDTADGGIDDTLVVVVTEASGENDSLKVNFSITPVNSTPVINQGDLISRTVAENTPRVPSTINIPLTASDHDDTDAQSYVWTVSQLPAHGTASIHQNPDKLTATLSYTPDAYYNSDSDLTDYGIDDTLVVTVAEASGERDTLQVDFSITPVNSTPVINEGALINQTLPENTPRVPSTISIPLSASDYDGTDAQSYVWTVSQLPSNGTASVHVNPDKLTATLSYTPDTYYNSDSDLTDAGIDDTLMVTVTEASGESDAVQVNFGITPVNSTPVINEGDVLNQTLLENTPSAPSMISIPLTASDHDGTDAQSYVWTVSQSPSNGTASVNVNPDKLTATLSYTPYTYYNSDKDTADNGIDDTLIVTVTEASGESDTVQVNLSITPVNSTPVINEGHLLNKTLLENTLHAPSTINIPLTALDHDDTDAQSYVWTVSQGPGHGTASVQQNPDKLTATVTYTPTQSYNNNTDITDGGIDDVIQVTVQEASGETDMVEIRFVITPVNSIPLLLPVSPITMDEDNQPIASRTATTKNIVIRAVDVDANDSTGETLTWRISEPPAVGSLVMPNTNGQYLGGGDFENTFEYTPANDATGTTRFKVIAEDSHGASANEVTVEITLTPVNDRPTLAVDAPYQITVDENRGQNKSGSVTLTATDVDGDALTWVLTNTGTNGTAVLAGTSGTNQTVTYTPNFGHQGTDSFEVLVNDGEFIASIVVPVTVKANEPPKFEFASYSLTVDEDSTGSVTLNTSDVGGNPLSWVITTNGSQGSATLSGTTGISQTVNYQPNANYYGTDQLTVTINDGEFTVNTTVAVTVNSINDSPVITQGSIVSWPVNEHDNNDNAGSGLNNQEIFELSFSATDIDTNANSLKWSISAPLKDGSVGFNDRFDTTLEGTSNVTVYYQGNLHYVGPDNFTVQVSDGDVDKNGNETIDTVSVNVDVQSTNTPPVITVPAQTKYVTNGHTATAISVRLDVTDSDGDTPVWSIIDAPDPAKGKLEGVSGTGTVKDITYTPYSYADSYTETYTIQVDDKRLGGTDTLMLTFGVGFPPEINQAKPFTKTVRYDLAGSYWVEEFTASDVDGSPLTWTLEQSPTLGEVRATLSSSDFPVNENKVSFPVNQNKVSIYYHLLTSQSSSATDEFTLKVTDDAGFSDSVKVDISLEYPWIIYHLKVCFYDNADKTGDSWCSGNHNSDFSDSNLGPEGVHDKITRGILTGDGEVCVYDNDNYGGSSRCDTVNGSNDVDYGSLGMQDNITSFKAYVKNPELRSWVTNPVP